MCPCADILHSSKPARHSGIGIELFHYGLSHSEVVGVASGLQTSKFNLTYVLQDKLFISLKGIKYLYKLANF